MSNHFVIKLITGDTLYGTISTDDATEGMLIVNDPLIWEEYYNEDGYPASTLVRYCSGSDESEIPIARTAIISMAAMSEDFAEFYDAAVGMTEMSHDIYKSKLQTMTCSMRNKISAYHAAKLLEDTDDLVVYNLFGMPTKDTNTIH